MDNTQRIQVGRSHWATIDTEDFELVSAYRWQTYKPRSDVYASTRVDGVSLIMHRLVLNAPKGVHVDHINHDTLDNRKNNLRLCTNQQNRWNARSNPGKRIPYKGVHLNRDKPIAILVCNGVRYKSRNCSSLEEAARVYDQMALKHFGEFAYLNFPEGDQQ